MLKMTSIKVNMALHQCALYSLKSYKAELSACQSFQEQDQVSRIKGGAADMPSKFIGGSEEHQV